MLSFIQEKLFQFTKCFAKREMCHKGKTDSCYNLKQDSKNKELQQRNSNRLIFIDGADDAINTGLFIVPASERRRFSRSS